MISTQRTCIIFSKVGLKWLMNCELTIKYWTIAVKKRVFYCYWRASNGSIHFPWLECHFIKKEKIKKGEIEKEESNVTKKKSSISSFFREKKEGQSWPIFTRDLRSKIIHPINYWNSHVTLTTPKWGTHVKYATSRPQIWVLLSTIRTMYCFGF